MARGRRPRRPREHHAPAVALLLARVEPGRERVGVPAAEQARPARLARLRRDRRHLLRRLELAAGDARPPRLNHPPRVGQSGQQLRPLVLAPAARPGRQGWAGLPLTVVPVSCRPWTPCATTPCPETPPNAQPETCTGPIGWSGKPCRLSALRLLPQVKPEKLMSRKVGR